MLRLNRLSAVHGFGLATPFLRSFLRRGLAQLDLFFRVHSASATSRSAIADGSIFIAVVKAVVVCDFLAAGDLLDSLDPHAAAFLDGLAVGVATVVDVHRRALAVDRKSVV